MAPSTITEDYYMLLEVEPNETTEQITRSYKRLALKLHPDRCAKGGSTQAFQLVCLSMYLADVISAEPHVLVERRARVVLIMSTAAPASLRDAARRKQTP